MAQATEIILQTEEKEKLQSWVRSGKTEQRMVTRARIILDAAQGKGTNEIAEALKLWPAQVSKWRKRFAAEGMGGLFDRPREGKPRRYTDKNEQQILAVLDQEPPEGHANWTATLIAERLADVSKDQVWRVLKKHGIHLQRRRTWCLSTDPEFACKAADIVGLYLNPPENAAILCVDEKPHIQALERAQGWLKLPNGKAITGENHRYKRHGTTTLFAALEVATGLVKTGHFQRRRRREFLHFMNDIVRQYPDQQIHVILDNLNTHKPKHDRWLAGHKNVHFHFTPTNACWLNQIEIWFSILARTALQGASFTSPQQLRRAIDDFTRAYNDRAAPFEWTKRVVQQKPLESNYSNLRN
jgi:transposase